MDDFDLLDLDAYYREIFAALPIEQKRFLLEFSGLLSQEGTPLPPCPDCPNAPTPLQTDD